MRILNPGIFLYGIKEIIITVNPHDVEIKFESTGDEGGYIYLNHGIKHPKIEVEGIKGISKDFSLMRITKEEEPGKAIWEDQKEHLKSKDI